jgi:hypothetical protein
MKASEKFQDEIRLILSHKFILVGPVKYSKTREVESSYF